MLTFYGRACLARLKVESVLHSLLSGILFTCKPSDSSSSSSLVLDTLLLPSPTRLKGMMGATPGVCGTRPLPLPSFLGRMINIKKRAHHVNCVLSRTSRLRMYPAVFNRASSPPSLSPRPISPESPRLPSFVLCCRLTPMHWTRPGNWTRSGSVSEPEGTSYRRRPHFLPWYRADRWWLGRSMGFHFWSRITL
jgi:hypothetical protein